MADSGLPALRSRRGLLVAQLLGLAVVAVVVVVAVLSSRGVSGPPAISVAEAWARATPGGATTAAVYLTIANDGGPDRLVSAAAPVAGSAMIHRTAIANDIATMTDMEEGLAVPGGATVAFVPGGNHLMLMDLPAPLTEGQTFAMTLDFAATGTVTIAVSVLGVAATGPAPGNE